MNILKYHKYYVNIFFCSIADLKGTPSDRQMYLWGYIYPILGTSAMHNHFLLNLVEKKQLFPHYLNMLGADISITQQSIVLESYPSPQKTQRVF